MGHEIKIAGLSYEGQEHNYPFSIIPARDTNDAHAIVHNICALNPPDVIVVALDIPLQISFHEKFKQYGKPYIAITPLENGPLCMEWSAPMFTMDWVFFISELGKQEALKAGLSKVDHIRVGIDTDFWRVPTPQEKAGLRKGMGIAEDEFVILTVAENQERKNLWAAMEIVSGVKKSGKKIKYILVTSPDSPYGWKLRSLAVRLDINQELMLMNKGMPKDNLWSLYAMSDCFLITSKAEGLGMPVLEAMSVGVPVVGTDTGAITELLSYGRGYLVPAKHTFVDVWGNSERKMVDIDVAIQAVLNVVTYGGVTGVVQNAREYVEARTWDVPAKQLSDKIVELTNVEAQ